MKHWLIGLCLFLTSLHTAYGLTVPFQDFQLFPGRNLTADYTMDVHKIIFCYEGNLRNVGVIVWPYQGQTKSSHLPIFLKNDPRVQGELADDSGFIGIQNNQNFPLFVSCVFGF